MNNVSSNVLVELPRRICLKQVERHIKLKQGRKKKEIKKRSPLLLSYLSTSITLTPERRKLFVSPKWGPPLFVLFDMKHRRSTINDEILLVKSLVFIDSSQSRVDDLLWRWQRLPSLRSFKPVSLYTLDAHVTKGRRKKTNFYWNLSVWGHVLRSPAE